MAAARRFWSGEWLWQESSRGQIARHSRHRRGGGHATAISTNPDRSIVYLPSTRFRNGDVRNRRATGHGRDAAGNARVSAVIGLTKKFPDALDQDQIELPQTDSHNRCENHAWVRALRHWVKAYGLFSFQPTQLARSVCGDPHGDGARPGLISFGRFEAVYALRSCAALPRGLLLSGTRPV